MPDFKKNNPVYLEYGSYSVYSWGSDSSSFADKTYSCSSESSRIETIIRQEPVTFSDLMSRALSLLEHLMLKDSNAEVRKSALEEYSAMVNREHSALVALQNQTQNQSYLENNINQSNTGSRPQSSQPYNRTAKVPGGAPQPQVPSMSSGWFKEFNFGK